MAFKRKHALWRPQQGTCFLPRDGRCAANCATSETVRTPGGGWGVTTASLQTPVRRRATAAAIAKVGRVKSTEEPKDRLPMTRIALATLRLATRTLNT